MCEILFNNTANLKERQETKKLSLEEENKVIEILNEALHFFDDTDRKVVQKFVYHYENLCHFASINSKEWIKYSS